MNRFFIILVALTLSPYLFSQSTIVRTFNYESTTRDTVIEFPEGDHTRFEKILMHYAMRCKDGLVSTGAQRNLGCGEWDYSCNTYVVDSTHTDSLKASSPDHIIPGFNGDVFEYRQNPTYTLIQREQKEVSYTNIIYDNSYPIGELDSTIIYPVSDFGINEGPYKLEYILRPGHLENIGLSEGDVSGISFDITQGDVMLRDLRVAMALTEDTAMVSAGGNYEWQELFFLDTQLNPGNDLLRFYENFEWDGQSSIAVRISYSSAEGEFSVPLLLQNYRASLEFNESNRYGHFGSSGHYHVDGDLSAIDEEITVSFWQFGASNMPVNSTIFEGQDAEGRRQINAHLPWGNGQVYWDCGNNGSGYDRINKVADPGDFKDQWNHWTFVKNATTGMMAIYLNGMLWHSGTGKYNTINVDELNIGAPIGSNSLYYYGSIDDFRIYDKALNEDEVLQNMQSKMDLQNELYDNLVIGYDFNDEAGPELEDLSGYENHAELKGIVLHREWEAKDQLTGYEQRSDLPYHLLHQGLHEFETTSILRRDSIINLPQKVEYYSVEGTDLILDSINYVYNAGEYPVYNDRGEQIDVVNYPPESQIEINLLNYYTKSPMAYELMSFVTPYGIGIDFGIEGHSWTFDVTEFAPVLKGQKRFFMSRGGEWQEEMDIRFEFIEGIPDRDVMDIQQIWPVVQSSFNDISSDHRFEPRIFNYDPGVSQYVVKAAITGHGQQGEFIPRTHNLNIGGFLEGWTVWKECADNPIYPQGGTWVYDRAGWCPGAPTDVRLRDVTEYFQFLQQAELDYSMPVASGDSRYIVNFQLIEYGPPNKSLDASIYDVLYPNERIEHARFNPSCQAPVVILKNNGAEDITSAVIEYGIEGRGVFSYEWQGKLSFLQQEEVTLDFLPSLLNIQDGDEFFARVVTINGTTDPYPANDEYRNEVKAPAHYESEILIEFKTNWQPQETSYVLYDENGNALHSRTTGSLNANTVYRDTIRGLNGCYRLMVQDMDDDGLSWWANNDGNGYVRMKSLGDQFINIATDFGKFVEYNFTAGMVNAANEVLRDNLISVYPNPSAGQLFINGLQGDMSQYEVSIFNSTGSEVYHCGDCKNQDIERGIPGLSDLAPGLYTVLLRSGTMIRTFKWVKI